MCGKFLYCLCLILCGIGTECAQAAEDECGQAADECAAVGHWNFSVSLGAGVRTNPVRGGAAIPLIVIPHISYYGKRFFIDNVDAGFTLADLGANTFSLIATPGYDRVFFYRSDIQNIFVTGVSSVAGVPSNLAVVRPDTPGAVPFTSRARHITYLAGPEWTFKSGIITGQLDVLREITGYNQGFEVRAAIGAVIFHARGTLTANLGLTWKDSQIVEYYYGEINSYEPGSALNPFLKLGYSLPLTGKWQLKAFAEYEKLAASIANSPIVDRNRVITGFVGANYAF